VNATAPCEYLAWDSRFFGVKVARVTAARLDAPALAAVDAWSAERRIDCLYFLADDAPDASAAAEDAGFRLIDVRVTLDRPVAGASSAAEDAALRLARPDDVPALRAIARGSHRDSRFYRDGRFERARCDALYETWIEQSCVGGAAAVWVAEADGSLGGYVTCERVDQRAGRIGLLAVAERGRGRGVGAALLARAVAWFDSQGLATATVVTQGGNVAAQRLYQAGGFRTAALQLWYHRWRRTT
jgi:dTDP-4-amino-4,6-dideoxy-D-galactose acyltransferase